MVGWWFNARSLLKMNVKHITFVEGEV